MASAQSQIAKPWPIFTAFGAATSLVSSSLRTSGQTVANLLRYIESCLSFRHAIDMSEKVGESGGMFEMAQHSLLPYSRPSEADEADALVSFTLPDPPRIDFDAYCVLQVLCDIRPYEAQAKDIINELYHKYKVTQLLTGLYALMEHLEHRGFVATRRSKIMVSGRVIRQDWYRLTHLGEAVWLETKRIIEQAPAAFPAWRSVI